MKDRQCSHCGYVGKATHDEFGSIILDIFAWAISIAVAAITGIVYAAFVGPLVTLWHFLTFRSHRCPMCGNWEMHRIPRHRSSLLRY